MKEVTEYKDDDVKKLAEWEVITGCIVVNGNPEQEISWQDFLAIDLNDKVGVQHEARTAFLKANGYLVTRENMVDSTLSAVVPPADTEDES